MRCHCGGEATIHLRGQSLCAACCERIAAALLGADADQRRDLDVVALGLLERAVDLLRAAVRRPT